MSVLKWIVFLLLVEKNVSLNNPSLKINRGHVQGYASDCPGSMKPASISKKALAKLAIAVAGGNGFFRDYRRIYNYYEVKEMIKDPYLDFKNKKTLFFFGGFMDTVVSPQSAYMAQAYRRLGYNVLCMEANWFVTLHYPISIRLLRPIGVAFTDMLTNLTAAGLDPKRLELAGVSLGAHMMSFVAKAFYERTGQKISLLIGMDPAGPCFRNRGPEGRLDASDGDKVMAIFTNIDGLGMGPPLGHINFYMNGGENQPGDLYFMLCGNLCSHGRSYMIWLSALYSPDYFIGMKCDSVQQARSKQCYDRVPREINVISNTKTDWNNTGIFYVPTTNDYPYYLGAKGLQKEFDFFNRTISEMNKPDVVEM